MKKISTLFFSAVFALGVSAQQQLPNSGFENWSYPIAPDGWETPASLFSNTLTSYAVKDTTAGNFTEGTASLKLTTDSVVSPNGKILLAGFAEHFGTFTSKPDTLKFSYKYAPGAGDTAMISINTYSYSTVDSQYTDYLYGSIPLASTSGNWYSIYVPLVYQTTTGTPDTILFDLSSSKGFQNNGTKGSVVHFDNIRFAYKTTVGIQEAALAYTNLKFFPNPATTQIAFDGAVSLVGHQIRIFSLDGKEVINEMMNSNTVNVSELSNGLYIFEVNKNGVNMLKGKFNVSK
ncbi:MAG: T9SS type A sorting domain-containing protein [Chitinophagales bacterium]|nr:T9SS type A sorting domain-containing protein [Chitinophagales bacterium]MCO5279434.1 T9SS type A sorting domain-containing protein [Chitinophagales bacterium]HRN94602.1 T9SS type A sorting domain-containing protein [Chitinophagales bacterium]HRP39349.1 T9SS type A sorting domain-containing protein [Chitinophagales bacterium]